jgi:hypothetical protein
MIWVSGAGQLAGPQGCGGELLLVGITPDVHDQRLVAVRLVLEAGTAGHRRAPAVTAGMQESQVTEHSRRGPLAVERGGSGFEPLTQPLPWAALGPRTVGNRRSTSDTRGPSIRR